MLLKLITKRIENGLSLGFVDVFLFAINKSKQNLAYLETITYGNRNCNNLWSL